MTDSGRFSRWYRVAIVAFTTMAVIGALHVGGLLVLAARGVPTLLLSGVAAIHGCAAALVASRLRGGEPRRAARWLGVWGATAVAAVGLVGYTFRPGPLFWGSSAGAFAFWGVAGWWIARRIRQASSDSALPAPPGAARTEVGLIGVPANEIMPQATPQSTPVSGSRT